MRFVILDLRSSTVASIVDIEFDVYEHLVITQNVKAAALRVLVTDPKPVPTSTERVVTGQIVVEATQARETWIVVQKTAQEIADEQGAEARRSQYEALRNVVNALRDGAGTAAERVARVERVCVRLLLDALVLTATSAASTRS